MTSIRIQTTPASRSFVSEILVSLVLPGRSANCRASSTELNLALAWPPVGVRALERQNRPYRAF
jgi:hypothetical protein